MTDYFRPESLVKVAFEARILQVDTEAEPDFPYEVEDIRSNQTYWFPAEYVALVKAAPMDIHPGDIWQTNSDVVGNVQWFAATNPMSDGVWMTSQHDIGRMYPADKFEANYPDAVLKYRATG